MRETLTLIAKITARPEGVAAMEELLMKLAAASRAEAGCAGYDYAFDMLEPGLMRVREWWRDEQALRDHFATPHMAAFLKALRTLKPASVTIKCHKLGPERKMPNA